MEDCDGCGCCQTVMAAANWEVEAGRGSVLLRGSQDTLTQEWYRVSWALRVNQTALKAFSDVRDGFQVCSMDQ